MKGNSGGGRLLTTLHQRSESIATMDLLIGTAAVVDSASIVTRSTRHFARIPDLVVVEY